MGYNKEVHDLNLDLWTVAVRNGSWKRCAICNESGALREPHASVLRFRVKAALRDAPTVR